MKFRAGRTVLLSVLITLSLTNSAKTDTLTGLVSGLVLDTGGTPLDGVLVTFTNQTNGHRNSRSTQSGGKYAIPQIEAGLYALSAQKPGFAPFNTPPDKPILLLFNYPEEVIPPIRLRSNSNSRQLQISPQARIALVALGQGGQAQTPAATPPDSEPRMASLVSRQDWALRSNFNAAIISALPLRESRTFDQLALFAPGVARAPFSSGSGPAAGIGVGSVGQFSVNGLRSRSNNFTVDGSDNNDEDINVRRQGFVALVPQSAESIAEFQIMTAGFPPEFGRNSGSMVNAISQSGQNKVSGAIYGLLNNDRLNSPGVFDTPFQDSINSGNLNGGRYSEKSSTNAQYGAVIGGHAVPDKLFYFFSGEEQRGHGIRLHHFVVPTKDERGLRVRDGVIPIEQLQDFFDERLIRYSNAAGLSVLSLYPYPNNSAGPFGQHNYSQARRFEANSDAFSGKADLYKSERFSGAARYNFTQDESQIPFTGEAINSAIGSATRTQNLSIFTNSSGSFWANALRISYGRTRLSFPPEKGSPLLFGSSPTGAPPELIRQVHTSIGNFGPFGVTGPIGQLSILPFSPVGVDVYNFPQGRVDNTYQVSDFGTTILKRHIAKAGFDIRYSQLNSFADRNSRPLVIFGYGDISPTCRQNAFCPFATDDGRLHGTDVAALGAPSAFLQALSTDPSAGSTIGLRFTQYDLFIQDDWNIRPRLTLNFGLRYELQTVPHEVHNRIERTFAITPDRFGHLAPTGNDLNQRIVRSGNLAFDQAVQGLQHFLGGRREIYAADSDNLGPRLGFAWDPVGDGKTAIRGGFSIQFDANPGAFTSQSRNVFPTFVPVNLDLNFNPPSGSFINSPTFFRFIPTGTPLVKPGTLNVYNLSGDEFATGLGTLFNQQPANPGSNLSSNGLAFTLPELNLQTSYARHLVLSAERQFGQNWLLSLTYVGTRGRHLPRFTTPNGGLISTPFLISSQNLPLTILDQPPYGGRPLASLGAITVMEDSAGSSYHGLQLSALKRFGTGLEFRSNWTWSHAIDEVSDIFDHRAAFALPEDSKDLRKDRASASFDARHRLAGYVIWSGSQRLRQWSLAATAEFQSGQPYTINTVVDGNGDGNLTDRPGIGRNTARAAAIHAIDLAATRRFSISTNRMLEVRIEAFNVFNWRNPATPLRVMESPGFGTSFDTTVDSRTMRLALKLRF